MYAVLNDEGLVFLGDCREEAHLVLESCPTHTLHVVQTLEDLRDVLTTNNAKALFTDAFETLTDRLDELGLNQEFVERVKENGAKLVGEAKSLGVRGLKAVGEGFVSLGELLRNTGVEEAPKACEKPGCCGGHGHHHS